MVAVLFEARDVYVRVYCLWDADVRMSTAVIGAQSNATASSQGEKGDGGMRDEMRGGETEV